MIRVRTFLGVIVGLVMVLLIWLMLNWSDIQLLQRTASAYYAKELCTCLFVLEQDESYCHSYTKQYVALDDLKVVNEGSLKRVEAQALGIKRTAVWRGARLGCHLERPQGSQG
ncbi:amidase [Pseudobacteriovorax antillogorgiicola]|uniref:Amidase n=1 Tax=Pseudobacteriovorax antillogorgiicola TaxID=1513793 RepID=A0A1Y6C4V2_9BACT|nr:amidase [Pseudobacteriovorax antillogorgiicola]TCS51215.1 hypothetical protein EDD56_11199 [Pseudobacteriovorax antillogorgiicola]SMF37068.1 hypothetical protein SAMN06296036_11179 [Pseudobacteriovorax antillogorgiicola]